MVKETSLSKTTKALSGVLFILSLVLVSLLILAVFLKVSYVNGFYQATFSGMVDGTAYRPFVTRVLIPLLIHFFQFFLPVNFQKEILEWISNQRIVLDLLSRYRVPVSYGIEALISLLLQFLCLLGFSYTFYVFAGKLFSFSKRVLKLITLLATLGLLIFVNYGYIYDFPELFLCTAAFYAIFAKRKTLYFLIFVLAVLNKETSLVLIIPSILLFWEIPASGTKKVAAGVFSQLAIFLLIRFLIGIRFQLNPGSVLSFHLRDQLQGILDHPIHGVAGILIFCCLVILLFRYWKIKPALITLGLVSAVVLFVFFVFFGMPFEYRVFYEVYAVSIFAIIHTISFGRNRQAHNNSLTTESFMNSALSLVKRQKI